MTPASARDIRKLGHECLIESGAGEASGFSDAAYEAEGVTVVPDAAALIAQADVIVKVRPPEPDEVARLREGQTLISFFYPAQNAALLEEAKDRGATVIAMDMVPRISRAQKMDALSSMANIAGYRAVIEAGANFGRFFTGQVTAAGKVPPAQVLVVGAGVAGLAAIGTAVSLGAVVHAFDVRPEVAEQIESMGANFVFLDFSDNQQDGAATGGYAAPSSPEFLAKQLEKFRELAPQMDIVITTALIPGRPAPKLWTRDMVEAMKPGSVIVDLAAERGGNCELTVPGEKFVTENGVTIIGYTDFPSRMAAQASSLYATNIRHMLADLTPGKDGVLVHNMEDDVIRGATVVHGRAITYPPAAPEGAGHRRPTPAAEAEGALARGTSRAGDGALPGRNPATGGTDLGRGDHPRSGGPLCSGELHGPCHRLCARLLRGVPGHLERLACVAYAAHGGHQCHLGHHHPRRAAAGRIGELARRDFLCRRDPDRLDQYRRRFPRHPADARHVPEVVR
ncbi:NAD(P) transhydrogenase, alpha subunit [Rubellimicrobium thermophilum DSM 16684]|uniref:NAD(P) transhydrogenase subunit alpha n=1 Tax=Rubellimicrobium thermophilum DSM 16684 TaxID=1123069 RepID=S9R380_9RHOB|nr:NAD(P) transhydrogenase, alpha subunit [Rubellimicrobium thermophilum DSM 16684]